MRQWIAIGAAVGVVAVTLPFVRNQDDKIADLLAKRKATSGQAVVTREVTPPPLTDLDLTRIDDRGNVATAPAHGDRKANLTISTSRRSTSAPPSGSCAPATCPRARWS
jgi:penicillin-binding protein A